MWGSFEPLHGCSVSSTPWFCSSCRIVRTNDANSLNTSTIIFDNLCGDRSTTAPASHPDTFLPSSVRSSKLCILQLLCLPPLTKTARVGGHSFYFGKAWRVMTTRTRFLFKFFLFTFLRTLLCSRRNQLFCFQSLPDSLPQNTRGGVWRQGSLFAGKPRYDTFPFNRPKVAYKYKNDEHQNWFGAYLLFVRPLRGSEGFSACAR